MDLTETRQPDLYASSTIPFFFAVLCVALRFWSRWSQRANFWLDDWLILAAVIFAAGLSGNLLWWIPRGLGKHEQTFGPNVLEDWSIGLFTAELTYTGVIVTVKFSIQALYWRIFCNMGSIRTPIRILAVIVMIWGIAVFLLTLLQCIPTRGFWDKSVNASCNVDSTKFLFAISIPNILVDITLLALPIPYVIRLNVSGSQKKVIITMFLLGGFVCIASVMRLVAVLTEDTTTDVTWNLVNQAIWANVEADFAIISACLPALRPVWVALRPKRFGKKQSGAPSYIRTIGSAPKKRNPASWGMSILKSNVDPEEDTRPFSDTHGVPEDQQHEFVPKHVLPAKAVAMPHSNGRPAPYQSGVITVENSWDVNFGHPAGAKSHG